MPGFVGLIAQFGVINELSPQYMGMRYGMRRMVRYGEQMSGQAGNCLKGLVGMLPICNFVENMQCFGLTVALLVFNLTLHSAHHIRVRENAGSPARKRGLWLLSKRFLTVPLGVD